MAKLAGRVALVTGGSRGFGRATAVLLAQEGADVVVNFRSAEAEARAVAGEVERLGRQALVVQADVADLAQAATLAQRTLDTFGRVDILVNNAGVIEYVPFVKQEPAHWRPIVDVNIYGPLNLTHQILPVMIERGYGRIINLSSMVGHVGGATMAVYAGTKGFVLAFTKSLAVEVGPYGVTVNAVCPASIPTEMNRTLYTPEYQVTRAGQLPLRRLGQPMDIAYAVLYLASDESAFMTGQGLDVNGGGSMA